MIKRNGTQTFFLKSLNTEKVFLFGTLDVYLIEIPQCFEDSYIEDFIGSYKVLIDRDFIFYQQENDIFHVRFKNLNGEFNLCGSGLLALATKLLNKNSFKNKTLTFKNKKNKIIRAKMIHQKPHIIMSVNKNYKKDSHQYLTSSNVLIQEMKRNELEMIKANNVENTTYRVSSPIGAYCGFSIEKNNLYLRYFTPWHGRNEDFATLSIFEYLAPIIGIKNQYVTVTQKENYIFNFYQKDDEIYLS
jgi:predicted PhzF superfamily epimerase YddE/YHI9